MNTNPDSTDAPILAHSIGGQRDEGRPEAKAPVYNPADGTISAIALSPPLIINRAGIEDIFARLAEAIRHVK